MWLSLSTLIFMGKTSMLTWAATVLGLCKKTQDTSALTKKPTGSYQSLRETQGRPTAVWAICLSSNLVTF